MKSSVKQIHEKSMWLLDIASKYMSYIDIIRSSETLLESVSTMTDYVKDDDYDVDMLDTYKEKVTNDYIKLEYYLSPYESEVSIVSKARFDVRHLHRVARSILMEMRKAEEYIDFDFIMLKQNITLEYISAMEVTYVPNYDKIEELKQKLLNIKGNSTNGKVEGGSM